jgi:hypothetical protein
VASKGRHGALALIHRRAGGASRAEVWPGRSCLGVPEASAPLAAVFHYGSLIVLVRCFRSGLRWPGKGVREEGGPGCPPGPVRGEVRSFRAEDAILAGTLIGLRRIVPVRAFASPFPAAAAADRVRLNAIAANTSQAALAVKHLKVDEPRRSASGPRPLRQVHQEPGGDRIELADVPEGEGSQRMHAGVRGSYRFGFRWSSEHIAHRQPGMRREGRIPGWLGGFRWCGAKRGTSPFECATG